MSIRQMILSIIPDADHNELCEVIEELQSQVNVYKDKRVFADVIITKIEENRRLKNYAR